MGVSPSFFVLSRSMPNKSLLVGWRDRWNRSLMQFLNRRVPTAVDVEDLAQETYLRLLRARDLSDVRNPQAYLLRVASHVVLEWRNNLARVELVSSADEDLVADETLPEFELDARLSQERLDEALAEMSPLMRAVLLLRLRDERSNQEIAQELALTPRQVRRYLAKGYERLHGALEN
jgi:RNA polymerase sigma factor (sigma-70 family)